MVPRKTWASQTFGRIPKSRDPEVSFLHGLIFTYWSLETFYPEVSGSDFLQGSRRLGESRILPFATLSSDLVALSFDELLLITRDWNRTQSIPLTMLVHPDYPNCKEPATMLTLNHHTITVIHKTFLLSDVLRPRATNEPASDKWLIRFAF